MFLRHNALAIAWALLILVLLGLPGDQFEKTKQEHLDKAIHLILFSVLYILLIVGFIKQRSFSSLRRSPHSWVMMLCMVYGALIEVFQGVFFVQRSIELGDVLSNLAGCLTGMMIFYAIYGRRSYL